MWILGDRTVGPFSSAPVSVCTVLGQRVRCTPGGCSPAWGRGAEALQSQWLLGGRLLPHPHPISSQDYRRALGGGPGIQKQWRDGDRFTEKVITTPHSRRAAITTSILQPRVQWMINDSSQRERFFVRMQYICIRLIKNGSLSA